MSINASEQRLAALSRQTFLSLWSYQNPFYDKGKELCDVLIVFGDDVIIMSDKLIGYKTDTRPSVAWGRWNKRAIISSISQLRGALKTIRDQPTAIYLDAKTSSPFPLSFPAQPRFHLIAIAHGSEEACKSARGTPSLMIDSRTGQAEEPFRVGPIFSDLFVHVFNTTALDALFECFDTTADFIHYLNAKEHLFSANGGSWVDGEENLIALFVSTRHPNGQGKFTRHFANDAISTAETAAAKSDEWQRLRVSEVFVNRRERLKSSYIIDNLIQQFAADIDNGALVVGQSLELGQHADAFTTLASEPRMARLLIGHAVADVLKEDPKTFWSVAVESPEYSDVMYVWLIYPQVPEEISDEKLEHIVGQELYKYVYVAMARFNNTKRFYGIALPNVASNRTSRFFQFAERSLWTDEMQCEADEISQREGIFKKIESTIRGVSDAY